MRLFPKRTLHKPNKKIIGGGYLAAFILMGINLTFSLPHFLSLLIVIVAIIAVGVPIFLYGWDLGAKQQKALTQNKPTQTD